MTFYIQDGDGPEYPRELGATVAKFRRKAAKKRTIFLLSKAERDEWADAIEKSIRAKQRAALQRELPSHNCGCASGTNYSDGRKISEAVRQQHLTALLAYPGKVRRERTAREWEKLYEAAMKEQSNAV